MPSIYSSNTTTSRQQGLLPTPLATATAVAAAFCVDSCRSEGGMAAIYLFLTESVTWMWPVVHHTPICPGILFALWAEMH